MADLRILPDKLETLLRKYRPEGTTRASGGGTTEFLMLCPFHPDTSPSFNLNLHKGTGYCFSCPDQKGRSLAQTIAQMEGCTEAQASTLIKKAGVYTKPTKEEKAAVKQAAHEACDVPFENIRKWEEDLHRAAQALSEIQALTGWTVETMHRFHIGWTGNAYVIPIINNDIVVNVKFYKPKGKPKYAGTTGHNQVTLWPQSNLLRPDPIWIMEGEKDCILANQLGLNAVTFTSGADAIAVEFLESFRDRQINVVYDIDTAGRSGAGQLTDLLSRVTHNVKNIELPAEGLPPNGDFSDFAKIHGTKTITELRQLEDTTENCKILENKTKVMIPDEVVDTYLEDLVPKKMFYRRVRMRVRVVSAAQGGTYLVPEETVTTCGKDLGDQCLACALKYSETNQLILRMKPEYPEIMRLVDNHDNSQKATIKQMLEIYPKCPKVKYEFKSFMSLYPIMLIPALEPNKLNHSYIMQTAWALNLPAKENEDYLAEAVIMAHPDTQEMVVLCYKLDKDADSVDEFELSPELREQLEIFTCPQSTTSTPSLPTSTTTSPAMSPTLPIDTSSTLPLTSDTTPPSASTSIEG